MASRWSRYPLFLLVLLSLLSSTNILPTFSNRKTMQSVSMAAENSEPLPTILDLSDLNKRNIGVLAGTIFDQVAENTLDYVSVIYFDNNSRMEEALIAGDIDAIWGDEPIMRQRAANNPLLRVLDEKVEESHFGFAFRREDSKLQGQVNAIIQEYIDNGEMNRLIEKWLHGSKDDHVVLPISHTESGEVLRFATVNIMPPFAYTDDTDKLVGLDIELAEMIAMRLGRPLSTQVANVSDLFSMLTLNKAEMIAGAITITPERSAIMSFSPGYFDTSVTALVRR